MRHLHHCVALGLLPLALGCKKSPPQPKLEATSAAASTEPSPDRVVQSKLLEGEELAFGLRLPRGLTLRSVYGTSAVAEGQFNPDDVAEYFRDHLDTKHVELGNHLVVFPEGLAKETKHRVRVEVLGQGIYTRVYVRDLERPVSTVVKPEAERWREVGLSPDGKRIIEHLE